MTQPREGIPPDPIICLGSLNDKIEDRQMRREDVVPFQYFSGTGVENFSLPALNCMSTLGLSSLAHVGDSIYITTDSELFKFPIYSSQFIEIPIPGLKDIHEMTVIDGKLWLANTGMNELICYDPQTKDVSERLHLPEVEKCGDSEDIVDTYHCNQCFEDNKGELLALVHHVDGKQHMVSTASKVVNKLKKQGNGGVINTRTGEVMLKGLKGPHSARVLPDETYVICDSGFLEICHYDSNWNLINKVSTKGWSRGVDIGKEHIYVGVSETRKRYLNLFSGTAGVPNCILVYKIETFRLVHEIVLKAIEQVNNVYIMTPDIWRWIETFKKKTMSHTSNFTADTR